MKRVATVLFALALVGCQSAERRVDAAEYDSYWLWAGVAPQPVLTQAKTIYILQGELRGAKNPRLISLRPGTPAVRHADLWIVYRIETLDWGEEVLPQIKDDITNWKTAGNNVVGVQIDFDAATRGLANYASFLAELRSSLPGDVRLGITGLLDWSAQGDSTDLNRLAGVVDEVVLQTYQGRHTIPGYENYLKSLSRLKLPYRIGLVQNGVWKAPDDLNRDSEFKGYVVFLLNPE
ncbi:DUF3142 domain-containing protein [Sphingorhabdus contaminans]|uniref:DUF3142 domain-containing protein n=1 Tax=Sphingorhabdus contaminans TaxID=1343899 RepID=A0A553W9D8_9SPHN|nr:DUF3142 domain-containing protein [Sphingorhabdus contaminans]TSB01307.1 DUF3142 domain-containing protein [Sphingorhabdus contaminans]